jgi:hypothetical protein
MLNEKKYRVFMTALRSNAFKLVYSLIEINYSIFELVKNDDPVSVLDFVNPVRKLVGFEK